MQDLGDVIAFVLTYNRKQLIAQCLGAILAQSEPPEAVLVIDNGSTDKTQAYLSEQGLLADPRVLYLWVGKNIGPAAGFDLGMRLAHRWGYDWIWMMDDDTIPDSDALKELKAAFRDNFAVPDQVGFLASSIVSADGKPNNVPDIDTRAPADEFAEWGCLLGHGLVKVRWSTLCSVLMPRTTLSAVGSISPDFFFSGDDIDFTIRIAEHLPCYLVGRSTVTHLRRVSGRFSILREDDRGRIKMFWYSYRNQLYIRRRYFAFARTVLFLGKSGVELIKALRTRPYPLLRARSIAGGIVAGLFFRPRHWPLDDPPPTATVTLLSPRRPSCRTRAAQPADAPRVPA